MALAAVHALMSETGGTCQRRFAGLEINFGGSHYVSSVEVVVTFRGELASKGSVQTVEDRLVRKEGWRVQA